MPKPPVKEQTEKSDKKSIQDQIKELEAEISKTKYNKATQGHIGLVKAKIARLKEKQETRGRSGPKFDGYSVRKTGDATVILIGFPSVGKSTLLNALTNANSAVGAYEFTTLTVIPGLLEYKNAKIQILDVPGIVQGAAKGTGRGREVLSCMRNADMVIFLVDVFHPEHFPIIQREVYDAHLRINLKKPDLKLVKTSRGGIDIGATVPLTKIDRKTIESILKEFKITNAQLTIRHDISVDQFIDAVEDNKHYIPGVVVLNKIDMANKEWTDDIASQVKPDLKISAHTKDHIEELKELIFQRLEFIRVYCKEVSKKADMNEPMIMREGQTVRDMCNKLHKDFITKFKFFRLWGSSRFPGQRFVNLDHPLKDGDVVEIHVR